MAGEMQGGGDARTAVDSPSFPFVPAAAVATFQLDAAGCCLHVAAVGEPAPSWCSAFAAGASSGGEARGFAEFEQLRRAVLESGASLTGVIDLPGTGTPNDPRRLAYGVFPIVGSGTVTGVMVTVCEPAQLKAALRANRLEQRLRKIIDTIPVPLMVIDSEGKIECWNPMAEALSGLSRRAAIGNHPEAVLPELARYVPDIARQLRRGPVHDLAITWPGPNGSTTELSAHCDIIDDPEGGLDSVVAMAFDVGPLREHERRIARLNRVHEVVSEIDSAIFETRDPDALLKAACRIAVDIGGFHSACVGRPAGTGRVHLVASVGVCPPGRAGRAALLSAFHGGAPVIRHGCEHHGDDDLADDQPVHRGSGSKATLPIRMAGRVVAAVQLCSRQDDMFDDEEVSLLSDVADHLSFALDALEAERLRGAAEARYRSLFERNPQPMWISDPASQRILAVNHAAITAYGYSRDEFLDMTTGQLGEPVVEMIGEAPPARAGGPGLGPVERHVTRDGRSIEVEIIGHDLEHNGTRARISLITDVTERRQFEARLRDAARDEAVGQLAAGIAHDFNNILAAVTGYADLLIAELGADPRADDAREIAKAGRRAADLTRQLLTFARRQVLKPRPVDANEVVSDVAPMLRRLIGESVALKTRFADEPAVVEVDPVQLEQVLVNLAVNARDAMPAGGELRLAVTLVEPGRRRHRLHGPAVLLTVADTGAGMAPEVLAHIFDPFYSTKGANGNGLGLAIVHSVIRQSGGEVWAESRPGTGTTFSMLLPRRNLEPVPLVLPPRQVEASSPTARILVVEDDPGVRRLVVRTLEGEGYSVMVAGSPSEAEALAGAGEDIDLVVTDVVMPGHSGTEMAERLRERAPAMRFLFMSGYEATGQLQADLTQARFLAKPFETTELIGTVREILVS